MDNVLERLTASVADRYRVERELGAGGMATVYLADDLRHTRKVAIKVLRPELAAVLGGERFLQEIHVTAQLQHPHILPLYDSGSADGLLFYVMPYIEGESLRQRLDRERQLPVDDVIELAAQVASALDYAHRHGVLHRDIKPENILLQEQQALVADFGIALALQAAAGDRLTQTGLSLGTPGYMSPEQATGGRELSARTDIYSLGCVVYEMLAGMPPFTGPTAQAVIARVVTDKPASVTTMRGSVPAHVAAAIAKALEKIPADRFATPLDFARALKEPGLMTSPRLEVPAGVTPRRRQVLLWVGLLGWGGAAVAILLLASRRAPEERAAALQHLSIVLPDSAPVSLWGQDFWGTGYGSLAISPDGQTVVYVARTTDGTLLYRRALESRDVAPIPGTEGALHAFFSPDGQWIGFLTQDALKKVSVAGGSPVPLGRVSLAFGGTWAASDTIIVGDFRGLVAVPGGGGDGVVLPRCGLCAYGWPQALPSGEWLLVTSPGRLAGAVSRRDGRGLLLTRQGLVPFDSAQPGEVIWGSYLRYSPSGHLLYLSGNRLMALPFDPASLKALGPAAPVLDDVRRENWGAAGQFALSAEGTLIYGPGGDGALGRLVWANRQGHVVDTLPLPPADYEQYVLAPDGHHLAWVVHPASGAAPMFATDLRASLPEPVAFPPGTVMASGSWSDGSDTLLVNGGPVFAGRTSAVCIRAGSALPVDSAPRGWFLSYAGGGAIVAVCGKRGDECARQDSLGAWLYDAKTRQMRHLLKDAFVAGVSLDGRWLVLNNENGVYLAPFENPAQREKVGPAGALDVLLSPDGGEIVYRTGTSWYSIALKRGERPTASPPVKLFTGLFSQANGRSFALAPDGRFLVLASPPEQTLGSINVVTGFFKELARLAPAGKD